MTTALIDLILLDDSFYTRQGSMKYNDHGKSQSTGEEGDGGGGEEGN